MITILNELTIDRGGIDDQPIHLWTVSYRPVVPAWRRIHNQFVLWLGDACLADGWYLAAGDDPHRENSLDFTEQDEDDNDDWMMLTFGRN